MPISIVCVQCGEKREAQAHNCSVILNPLEQDVLALTMAATWCDHFCCGWTPEICVAKHFIQAMKHQGYKLMETSE